MAWIPKDAHWYIAGIVLHIRVERDPRVVTHVNYVLIEANSPMVAFRKARALGRSYEVDYPNPKGRKVTTRFEGLRQLMVVYEDLEDGSELYYQEQVSARHAPAPKLARPRSELAVFLPMGRKTGPDYASGEIVKEAKRRVAAMRAERRRQESSQRRSRPKMASRPFDADNG